MKEFRYHIIYKTTNILNNKFYIGMHSTNNIDDDYIGSGRRLYNSIKAHGRVNHKTEILHYCKTREELCSKEKEIVNEDLIKDSLCLNLMTGGHGGATHEWSTESRTKSSLKLKNRNNTWGHKVSLANKGKRQSQEIIDKAAQSRKGDRNGSWLGVDLNLLKDLRENKNLTIKQISEAMNISISTVKRKLKLI